MKDGGEEQPITRSSDNNYKRLWEYLNELRNESAMPYEIHAFKELGYADLDYSLADGTFLTAQQIQSVIFILCPQYKYQSLYPQDKGKLMRSFRQWVYTENTPSSSSMPRTTLGRVHVRTMRPSSRTL